MTFLPFTWGSLRLRWRDFYGGHEKRLSRKSLLMERMIVMIFLFFQPKFVTLLRNGNVQMVENALINAEDVMDIRIVPIFQTRTKIFAQIVILLFIENFQQKVSFLQVCNVKNSLNWHSIGSKNLEIHEIWQIH